MNVIKHKILHQFRFVSVVVVAATIGGLSTAVVMAAIPSSNGSINGCYNRASGALKVVDAETGRTCNALENSLSWQQNGQFNPTTVSKRVVAQYGANEDQEIVSITGYGSIKAIECDADTSDFPNGRMEFKNTSGGVLRVTSPQGDTSVQNNESINIGDNGIELGDFQIFKQNGSNAVFGTLLSRDDLLRADQAQTETCTYQVSFVRS